MRTIQIDEDVYRFLVENTKELGESASDILRRLLDIPDEDAGQGEAPVEERAEAQQQRESEGKPKAPEKPKAQEAPKAQERPRAQEKPQPQEKPEADAKPPTEDKKTGPAAKAAPKPDKQAKPEQATKPEQVKKPEQAKKPAPEAAKSPEGQGILEFLESPEVTSGNATTRYLEILGFIVREKSDGFDKALGMKGRSGRYFAKTKREIERSATITHPRPIPSSSYWAMTDLDEFQKRDVLREAMELLKYDPETVRRCVAAIR